ncbi:hypothetical protein ABZ297_16935 [Nonomuraea sp. NPDC005983]|uniref:hypothetical protein n=1 Tax=Nonomuraea sp. NPDC005983 TaxID=3155595 RepID=UPI0033AA4733
MDPILAPALILLAVAFVVYRQMMTRPTARSGLVYVAGAMIVLGLVNGALIDTRHLTISITLLVVESVAAVALGAVRAATVRVWMDAAGVTWSKATGWTMLAWAGSVVARVGLYYAGTLFGLASSTNGILFFMGLTVGVQALLVAWRGQALARETRREDSFVR